MAFSTKSSSKSRASKLVDDEEDDESMEDAADADEEAAKKENKTISIGARAMKHEKSSTSGKCLTTDLKSHIQWTNMS